ncbi:ganglioside-induced differentiation-associated protein 1 isoform X1 [Anastrepha obliqua]|uniref:ganglioside-induced differentiation-associated protein 1 isoform X1 n=1 Tax=Anastrepha obliqua TaxID=95512 RepID=UPI00240932ED|nr:ganglioside-induced differentiation-associated protein 1 isoform X1 [Anastrepha obliqua]
MNALTNETTVTSQTLLTPSATTTPKKFKAPQFKDDSLILYFHPYNFHSQKVILILYEKNIDFVPYAIDLANGEQYSAWFLNLNPKGDVPVLQDGAFVIPDSSHIIGYVENKFRGSIHSALKPRGNNADEFKKMEFFESIISQLPVGALSLGSFIHEDLKLVPKPPFIGPIRKSCLKNNEKVYELLKQSIDEAETNKASLLRKLDIQDKRKRMVQSRVEFQKILDAVHNVLRYIDNDFKENSGREWLVSNEYSLADVSFGLLLHRLYQLGFENYYWSYGKMPYVESYFLRFRKRPTYQKLMPSNFKILKDIWQNTPANYKIGAGAGFLDVRVICNLRSSVFDQRGIH